MKMLNISSKTLFKMPDCHWQRLQKAISNAKIFLSKSLKTFEIIVLPQIDHFNLDENAFKINTLLTSSSMKLEPICVGYMLQKISWKRSKSSSMKLSTKIDNEINTSNVIKKFWLPSPSDFLEKFIRIQINNDFSESIFRSDPELSKIEKNQNIVVDFFEKKYQIPKIMYISDLKISFEDLSFLFFIIEKIYLTKNLINNLNIAKFVGNEKIIINDLEFNSINKLKLINELKI